jgi:hypothetical protein
LVEAHRRKIREGELILAKADTGKKQRLRYCFLFSDIMLVSKLEEKKYWLRIHITLKTAKLEHFYLDSTGSCLPNPSNLRSSCCQRISIDNTHKKFDISVQK